MRHHIPRQFLETENASGTLDLNHTLTAVYHPNSSENISLPWKKKIAFHPRGGSIVRQQNAVSSTRCSLY